MLGARRYLPSMASLLALEAVERLQSASAAAVELSLTQGAVSRQLKVLEDQLGLVLLVRDKQRLRLTPAAQDYVREVRRCLGSLQAASLRLRANPLGGALNLAILPAFGMHWLAPRLAGFARLHPEVTVNLSTRLAPFDFASSGFDAAIHYGREDWPGARYLRLMEEEVLAVVSPSLLNASLLAAPLSEARAVLGLPLLHLESRTGDWGRWLAHYGCQGLRPPGMLFDHFATMMQGAVHGLGAAILPLFLLEEALAQNRLVPVFGPAIRALGSYYLVWPQDRAVRAPLASFIGWLGAHHLAPASTPPQSGA